MEEIVPPAGGAGSRHRRPVRYVPTDVCDGVPNRGTGRAYYEIHVRDADGGQWTRIGWACRSDDWSGRRWIGLAEPTGEWTRWRSRRVEVAADVAESLLPGTPGPIAC